jgi:hypothetical protein
MRTWLPKQRLSTLTATAVLITATLAFTAAAQADPPPAITSATANSTNHLVVNWTPDGHRSPHVWWNTEATLEPSRVGQFVEGVPLACIWSPGAPTCTGSEAATVDGSLTSNEALAPGTYYVQVEDMFDGTSESHWDDKWHFSNVVQVVVSAIAEAPAQPVPGAKAPVAGGGNGNGGGAGHPGFPPPQANLHELGKAYGKYCGGQKDVACLKAMATLATGKTRSPQTACKSESKKNVPGQKHSRFWRCVYSGKSVLKAVAKATHGSSRSRR